MSLARRKLVIHVGLAADTEEEVDRAELIIRRQFHGNPSVNITHTDEWRTTTVYRQTSATVRNVP